MTKDLPTDYWLREAGTAIDNMYERRRGFFNQVSEAVDALTDGGIHPIHKDRLNAVYANLEEARTSGVIGVFDDREEGVDTNRDGDVYNTRIEVQPGEVVKATISRRDGTASHVFNYAGPDNLNTFEIVGQRAHVTYDVSIRRSAFGHPKVENTTLGPTPTVVRDVTRF
jgi:hypothetical protein